MKKIIMIILAMAICIVSASCADGKSNETTQSADVNANNDDGDDIVFSPTAQVVNKNGAKGVVTYVIDDGYKATADFAASMLEKFDSLRFSFAVQSKHLATLEEKSDGKGGLEYAKDENGNYKYTVNETNVKYWQDILELGRTEIINHTHTHSFWGTNDDGGVFQYVNSSGALLTSELMPKGSSAKELYAPKQIFKDLFGEDVVSFIHAGIRVKTKDTTVDGVNIPSYKTYFDALLKNAILSGDYIGARTTFQATSGFEEYVNTKDSLAILENRMNVQAFMILEDNAGENIKNWTDYIDKALEMGGWACFCIHQIAPENPGGHYISDSQAKKLFLYTDQLGDDVWIAEYTDAMMYYAEWSTAEVSAEYSDGAVSVTLTDGEANNSLYNHPLTVKVTVPEEWSTAWLGDTELDIKIDTDGSCYVLANIVPDTGTVQIVGEM